MIDVIHHRLHLLPELPLVSVRLLLQPGKVELDHGQCLAQLIMNFASHARSFFLTNGIDARGEVTELLTGQTEFFLGFFFFAYVSYLYRRTHSRSRRLAFAKLALS